MTPLHVAFIWHQHQPDYRDPFTGIARLPWTRLHAAKDYLHMAELVAEFPSIHCTINFVPSLLDQLGDHQRDEWEELSLRENWTRDEKQFLLEHFFSIHPRLLERYPAYVRLRGSKSIDAPDQYFRDLAAWFNLAWSDPHVVDHDPALNALVRKAQGYSSADIATIIVKQREVAARVVPFHKELAARGQIDISVTPYYHPILPLLIDQHSAREAMPDVPLPNRSFVHPEDAAEQMQRAARAYQKLFGVPAHGLWPSEGSVSDVLIGMLPENFQWLATDEAILARSLGVEIERDGEGHVTNPRLLYQPYRRGERTVLFRDHFLADQISFKYHSMSAQDAASDFIRRLHVIRQRLADDPSAHLVSVVMDGENAWEAYKNNGDDFFRSLYSLLSDDQALKTVTVSEYLEEYPPLAELDRLAAGSWINANFDTWIGGAGHNRAWELLELTRAAIVETQLSPDQSKRAWEELYVAEGSDWFWWYSTRNNSGQDKIFDELFRSHLRRIYELIGHPAPQALNEAIKK